MSRRRGLLLATVAVAALAGCSTGPPAPAPPTPSTATGPPPGAGAFGAPGCAPPSPVGDRRGTPELPGTSAGDVSLYALVMTAAPLPLHASSSVVKFVVRMTGDGELVVTVLGPDGGERRRAFGPELHTDSTYDRPGREWGVGAVLDRPGCWQLHFERTQHTADLYLAVLP